MDEIVPDTIRRIAVLRANGLGDFLFATPALRALSRRFPRAEITLLGKPEIVAFVEGRYPYLHRAEIVPYFPTIRRPHFGRFSRTDRSDAARKAVRATMEFFARHQANPFDLAIQMQGGGVQSNPFVRMLGARRTAGLMGGKVNCPLDLTLTYQFYQPEVTRYLELVQLLGVPPDASLQMDAPELRGDLERLRQVWPDAETGDYVVIQPGVSDERRRWPIDRFAALAAHVARKHRKRVVVTGGLNDRPYVAALRAAADLRLVDLAGQIDLGAFAALVRRADLVVCNDSGASNLAHAVGAPSVVIYWSGNAITAGHFSRARFRPIISFTDRCPRCNGDRDRYRPDCAHDVSFVIDARLEEALVQVDDLLAQPDGNVPRNSRAGRLTRVA